MFDAATFEDTREILSGMNTDGELVLTSYTSYVQSRSVHGVTPVMVLHARKAIAMPNLPGQYYRRSDALFVRAFAPVPFNDQGQVWQLFTVSPRTSILVSCLLTNKESLGASALLRVRV